MFCSQHVKRYLTLEFNGDKCLRIWIPLKFDKSVFKNSERVADIVLSQRFAIEILVFFNQRKNLAIYVFQLDNLEIMV